MTSFLQLNAIKRLPKYPVKYSRQQLPLPLRVNTDRLHFRLQRSAREFVTSPLRQVRSLDTVRDLFIYSFTY